MTEQARPSAPITPLLLFRLTFEKWYADNMPRHAAALAYYTMFAVAPLLVIVLTIAGAVYGREAAQGQIVEQVEQYINSPETAALIQTILVNTDLGSSNLLVAVISIIALFYSATSVFSELQITLNLIWNIPTKVPSSLWEVVRHRLLALLMVLVSGGILFLSVVITTVVAAANRWAVLRFPTLTQYSEWSYFFLFFGLTTLIFALIYRFVPDVRVPWHDISVGAISTALLISVARLLLSWYLSHSSLASLYGAAGSLALLLLWVYYSAQIFLLGAEFTHVYGQLYGANRRSHQPVASSSERPPTDEIAPSQPRNPVMIPVQNLPNTPEVEDPVINAASEPSALVTESPAAAVTSEEPVPARPRFWRLRAIGQRISRLGRLPLTLTRPVGEIALAAGVISVASVLTLLWLPLRRRPPQDKPDNPQ